MTTYYISPNGSDLNTGLGPDASHATNKPWLTLGKAMNTGSVVLPGDTVYVAPGTFYGEALAPLSGITSSGSPTQFIGDPLNEQGFKDGSGVRRAAGRVYITSRTAGNDDAAGGGTPLNLGTNDPAGLTIKKVVIEAAGDGITVDPRRWANGVLEDVTIISSRSAINFASQAPTAGRNWVFRRCILIGARFAGELGAGIAAATANADLNILFEGCLSLGTYGLNIGTSAGNKAGGIHWKDCTMLATGQANLINMGTTGGHSTTTTSDYTRCVFVGGLRMASSSDAGCIVDAGYNRGVACLNANTNVTEAGTTVRNVMPRLALPDLLRDGLALDLNAIFSWLPDAPSAILNSGGTSTVSDFRGRTVRPWGGGPTIGYLEAGYFAQDTGSQITGGGANSLKITGAGEVSIYVPVDATSTTLSVITESTTYGGTNYPQLIVMANPSIGVTQQTDSAAAATEETLSVSFTPTAKGVVEARLISRSTSVTSATYFDVMTRA